MKSLHITHSLYPNMHSATQLDEKLFIKLV